MFDGKPEISTAMIALVLLEIFFLIDSKSMLKVYNISKNRFRSNEVLHLQGHSPS